MFYICYDSYKSIIWIMDYTGPRNSRTLTTHMVKVSIEINFNYPVIQIHVLFSFVESQQQMWQTIQLSARPLIMQYVYQYVPVSILS